MPSSRSVPTSGATRTTNTVDVTFDIQEGPRVYVERINISGNTRTLDKVIRREFRLAEGDAFSTAKVRRSQERLRNLGFFEKVDISAAPGSAPDKTNLEVQVVEQSTGEISFGAGYLDDRRHRGRHLDQGAQSARQGPGTAPRLVARHLEHHDRSQLHRAVFPGSQHGRPASTSSGRRTIARRLRTTASAASASRCAPAGPTREHTRQIVRYTLRQTNIYNVQPWASPIVQPQAGYVGRLGDFRNDHLGYARHAHQYDQGLAAAQYDGGRRRSSAPSSTSARRPTPSTSRASFEDVVASIGGSAGIVLPYNNSYTPPEQPVLHRWRHAARLRGRRHRSSRCQHDRRAGRPVLLYGDRRTQLSALWHSQGTRPPRQGVRRYRVALGRSGVGSYGASVLDQSADAGSARASASSGYRRSGRSASTMPSRLQ